MSNVNNTRGRGRPSLVSNKRKLAETLNGDLNGVSLFVQHQLKDAGFIDFEPVKTGKRGRPSFRPVLTGKANGFLALSRNWLNKGQAPFVKNDEPVAA